MSRVLVSISYNQSHNKGGPLGCGWETYVHGQTHAEWLEATVKWWKDKFWHQVIVSAVGWPGISHIETRDGNRERDVLWRIYPKIAAFVTSATNPGHQQGAALTIWQGLEYAAYIGYDYLVHTAEDILPHHEAIVEMVRAVQSLGYSYAGEQWGHGQDWSKEGYGFPMWWDEDACPEGRELDSQFFACRVADLVNVFDVGQLRDDGYLERCLGRWLQGKKCWYSHNRSRTTHDPEEFKRWLANR
jgi:hypothetical protein